MGVTGSGKSTFISKCCGPNATASIGHSMRSCTSDVAIYPFVLSDSCTVYLIDTPGFDDSHKSGTEVLNDLAAWLVAFRVAKILLHGIIYLHRITDTRMQGSAKKNLLLFKKLCGQNALKNVVLATTMWEWAPSEMARSREKELIETSEYWGYMMKHGSMCFRVDSPDSEKHIVQHLANHNNPVTTDLQTQLVDERRRLNKTSAGQELQTEVAKDKRRWERAVQETRTEMREAKRQSDHESLRALEEELCRCKSEIKRSEERRCFLDTTMKDLIVLYNKQVADMEEQQAFHYGHPVRVELPSLEDQTQPTGQPIEVEQPGTTPGPSNELVLYGTNDVSEIPAQDLR
ncbi:hypothetical protein NW755_003154 [Fusarium falciforme]|uniref:G domain-containing protein n=1 Tax=Fusarium falciforme TaxID=195108 RepID=A0A9W8RFK7_9HYPO|nr:hypothetical protein NW755_003154 [Fusarium falciforme]